MEIFYIAVLIIAVFFLIIILTTLGLLMKAKNNAIAFPPSKSTCPDYWTVKYDATDTEKKKPKCEVPSNNVNAGKVALTSSNTIGYTAAVGQTPANIDFSVAGWAGVPGKTAQCAIHDWAVTNEIVWDGVSNFTGC